jgi:hypothetical protein
VRAYRLEFQGKAAGVRSVGVQPGLSALSGFTYSNCPMRHTLRQCEPADHDVLVQSGEQIIPESLASTNSKPKQDCCPDEAMGIGSIEASASAKQSVLCTSELRAWAGSMVSSDADIGA